MHFTRSILTVAVVALTARWCGYEHSCKCDFDRKSGCVPHFDECGQQWYWPPQCTGCEPCLELCVDFFTCNKPTKP
ncbi:hypothetical protein B0H13DRAFT_2039334 [Mycena leptocephala]|nr:hypothetical protein B0H13DRAFT_2039334 [Mycena leptocephala]